MNGDTDQALAVMRKLAIAYPKDRDVLAAYGKSLAGAGQFEPALDAIRRAQTPEYPDWKLASAEGAILDQMGDAAAGAQSLPQGARPEAERAFGAFQSRHVLCAGRRSQDRRNLYALGVGTARRRQPRPPEPGAGRRAAGPLRRGRADRQPGTLRPSRRRPTSPISARCCRSRMPGSSSRTATRRKPKKPTPT